MDYKTLFLSSVKRIWSPALIMVFVINVIFFAILSQTLVYTGQAIQQKAIDVAFPGLENLQEYEQAQILNSKLASFQNDAFGILGLGLFVILVAWTILRWLSWSYAKNKKLDAQDLLHMTVHSLVCALSFIVISFILVRIIEVQFLANVMLGLVLIYLHYNWIGASLVMQGKSYGKTVHDIIRIGTKKAAYFILPYITILVLARLIVVPIALGGNLISTYIKLTTNSFWILVATAAIVSIAQLMLGTFADKVESL